MGPREPRPRWPRHRPCRSGGILSLTASSFASGLTIVSRRSDTRHLTEDYRGRLPEGVALGPGERLVVIPGRMLSAAKAAIADA
nr:hypothetical protein KitaXyl93_08240 [Kitasatospora sp. Xyl93]